MEADGAVREAHAAEQGPKEGRHVAALWAGHVARVCEEVEEGLEGVHLSLFCVGVSVRV